MSLRRLLLGSRLATLSLLLVPAITRAQSEPRLPELLASADQAWGAGKYDDAFDRYQAVLRRDSTSARAVFRVATLLAWRNDLDRSIALFRLYSRLAPGDADGRIALARSLAWRGHYAQSIAICDSILSSNARQREAALLAAQAVAWSGSLQGAITRYQRWLAVHPDDAEAWTGLGQVWRWAGRNSEARQALQHALEADPRDANARLQLEWTNVALSPSVEPMVTSTDDSDHNRSTVYLLRAGLPTPSSARVLADASYRVAELGAREGTSTTLRAASSWTPFDAQWTLRSEAGVVRLDASDGAGAPHVTHVEPIISARMSGRVSPLASLGAGVTRAAFDETASLILAGIATTSIDGDADITLRPHLGLGGGGGWTKLSGGSGPNSRLAGSGALRWTLSRTISVAGGVRAFAYDHAAFDGYFAPKRFVLAELSGRLHLGGELGWGFDSDVGLGNQTITAFDNSTAGRFAQRVSASILYRPVPGMEWGLSGGFANVASPTTISSADYRVYSLSIKGRVRL